MRNRDGERRSLATLTTRATLAAATAATMTAAAAGPAHGQAGHSLSMSGPGTGTVGEIVTIQATGVVPADVFLNRYLNVYAIPSSAVPSCPATLQSAIQVSSNTSAQGGETVANTVPAEGRFSIPVVWTPSTAGSFLLCGYVHEGVETMATASHPITVRAAGGSGGGGGGPSAAAPSNTGKPTISRRGRKLRCGRGSWSGTPTDFTYRWTADGRPAGSSRRTLRITGALEGSRVRCTVTASNAAGSDTARSRAVRVR